jgi:hypothetical protein
MCELREEALGNVGIVNFKKHSRTARPLFAKAGYSPEAGDE